jgi:hypothetical protein
MFNGKKSQCDKCHLYGTNSAFKEIIYDNKGNVKNLCEHCILQFNEYFKCKVCGRYDHPEYRIVVETSSWEIIDDKTSLLCENCFRDRLLFYAGLSSISFKIKKVLEIEAKRILGIRPSWSNIVYINDPSGTLTLPKQDSYRNIKEKITQLFEED